MSAMWGAKLAGFAWTNTIIWAYNDRNGQPTTRLAGHYEPICVFTSGQEKGRPAHRTFHPERIKVPAMHPGKLKVTRGRNRYRTGDTKLPGDVWGDIPRVQGQSRERAGMECQKPEELLRRLILLYTEEGDLVCDPRMGSGTTGVAARELGRGFVGIERHPVRFEISKRRIHGAKLQRTLFEASAEVSEEAA
jgi:DNA modification methylase